MSVVPSWVVPLRFGVVWGACYFNKTIFLVSSKPAALIL